MPNVNYQKTPPTLEEEFIIRSNGEPYCKEALRRGMERFAVKRGLEKKIGGNAGLARLATNYFDNIEVDAEGVFTGSFAILTGITGHFGNDGKLVMDVNQMKGEDLSAFLSAEGGREQAMESRKRWSSFLDKQQDIPRNNVETKRKRTLRNSPKQSLPSRWRTR